MTPRPWITAAADRTEAVDLSDKVTVTRDTQGTEVTDPVTGIVTRTPSVIWTGPALISAAKPSRTVTLGDDRVAEADHRIRLPTDPAICQTGDLVTVIDSDNPDLISSVFDVLGVVEPSVRVTRQVWARRVALDPQR